MRLISILLILFFISSACLADDIDAGESNSSWDSFGKSIDNSFINTKPVTKELFDKTLENVKSKGKKRKKNKNEVIPLSPVPFKENQYDQSELQSIYNKIDHSPTIMIPTKVITDNNTVLNTGYYKLSNRQVSKNRYNLVFSQGTAVIAECEANQTEEDYKQKDINFVNVIPISDKYIKVIYGTMDLNLETYLEVFSK